VDVHFNPDLQDKLLRMTARQGRAAERLVEEAVVRLVDYDEWFLKEVDKGWLRPMGRNLSSTATSAE
jgi:hypothetical protein